MLDFLHNTTGLEIFRTVKLKKIFSKQPKQIILPKLVRHPFQVINISPYPFWIGFSLFGFMSWFGLFFLNSEWANNALTESLFNYEYWMSFYYSWLLTNAVHCVLVFRDLEFFPIAPWIWETFILNDWPAFYANIISTPSNSFFSNLIPGSAFCFYVLDPLFYSIINYWWDGLISLINSILNILSSSLIADIREYWSTGHSDFKGLTKFVGFIPFIIPVGCPFRFVTILLGAKIVKGVSWSFLTGFVIIIYSITNFLLSWNVTYYTLCAPFIFFFIVFLKFYYLFSFIAGILINMVISPLPLIIIIAATWRWMSDISIESFRGEHTQAVQQNLLWGAYLFMLTEIIIFITLFQTTGYFWINPAVETSEMWKFPGIYPPYTFGLGLANLILLLNSGWILQIARKRLIAYYDFLVYKRGGEKRVFFRYYILGVLIKIMKETNMSRITNFLKTLQECYNFDYRIKKYLGIKKLERGDITLNDRYLLNKLIENSANYTLKTIFLGTIFMIFQFIEYSNLSFSISSGIYGTCFYCLTGLHGFHVIVGLLLLSICWWQFHTQTFALDDAVFFWFSARYWQFVDFVWVGVWLAFYFDWSLLNTLFSFFSFS